MFLGKKIASGLESELDCTLMITAYFLPFFFLMNLNALGITKEFFDQWFSVTFM